jgi:hypothetical protein
VSSAGGSATLTVNEAGLISSPPTATLLNPTTNGALPGQAAQTISIQAASANGAYYINSVTLIVDNSKGNGYYSCQVAFYPQYITRSILSTMA